MLETPAAIAPARWRSNRFADIVGVTAWLTGRRDHLIQSEPANEPRLHEMSQHGITKKDH